VAPAVPTTVTLARRSHTAFRGCGFDGSRRHGADPACDARLANGRAVLGVGAGNSGTKNAGLAKSRRYDSMLRPPGARAQRTDLANRR